MQITFVFVFVWSIGAHFHHKKNEGFELQVVSHNYEIEKSVGEKFTDLDLDGGYMIFAAEIRVPLRMNCRNSVDPLSFHVASR